MALVGGNRAGVISGCRPAAMRAPPQRGMC